MKKEKKKSGWFSWLTGEPEEVVSVELDTKADSASKFLHSFLKEDCFIWSCEKNSIVIVVHMDSSLLSWSLLWFQGQIFCGEQPTIQNVTY